MLGKGVARYYRKNVRGNKLASDNLIQKKLTRNILLAKKYHITDDIDLYLYGNLLIFVGGNIIIYIHNIKRKNILPFKIDKDKYNKLNDVLAIV